MSRESRAHRSSRESGHSREQRSREEGARLFEKKKTKKKNKKTLRQHGNPYKIAEEGKLLLAPLLFEDQRSRDLGSLDLGSLPLSWKIFTHMVLRNISKTDGSHKIQHEMSGF